VRHFILVVFLFLPFASFGQDRYLIDWDAVGEEAIGHLVNLVQINTSNPPGNETRAANYVQAALAAEGIDSKLFALDPDRANLVARIRGNGSKRPILIMGHTDVVGVQADRWTGDPFGGLRKDGWIYGRGTLDDKDNVTAGLMLMILLKRQAVELDRDVIFLAESGEEGTPGVGINFMVEHHWDEIAAEFALAEGGENILEDSGVSVVGIQTAEKKARRATLVASGTAGHGSIPRLDNPVTAVARAVAKLGDWETEMRLNPTTRAYFERLATISTPEDAWRYRNIENPSETEAIQRYFLEHNPYHYSVLRTSVVPTIIKAGFRKNVIPSEATAVLDIRMLPDEDVDAFYEKMRVLIDNPAVEVVPEPIYRPESDPSPVDNEMFQTLERVAKQMYPGATVLPRMSTGATDMAQVRSRGTAAYGIGATRSNEEINSGMGAHGDNERVSEESVEQLVEFVWRTIIDIAATK